MATRLKLGAVSVDVVLKDIKNLHLSVHPPTGRVRISAPRRMKMEAIRVFAISKLDWIKRQQRALQEQERETPREYLDRESHYVWGRRYLLEVREAQAPVGVDLTPQRLVLRVRPGTDAQRRSALLDGWYRRLVKDAVPGLLGQWAPRFGVNVARVYVRQMKTRWGSCNRAAQTIRLNTELAKKPPECLEYVLVHELIHLLEPSHGPRFVALMNQHMPKWRLYRDELNRFPVRHESWSY